MAVSRVIRELQAYSVDHSVWSRVGFSNNRPLTINGKEHLAINYARCCLPIPGDGIMGFLSAGFGITVHRDRCHVAIQLIKEARYETINVLWSEEGDRQFTSMLELDLINQKGALASVCLIISELFCNIEEIKSELLDSKSMHVVMCVSVGSRSHLSKVVRRLRHERNVVRIKRVS